MTKGRLKLVEVDDIIVDAGTEPRCVVDPNTIEEYAEAMKSGAEFPPVVVFTDGKKTWLADGFHRLHAHDRLKRTKIQAEVRRGVLRDALWYALGANQKHGVRRTNADKRYCVRRVLEDRKWRRQSDSIIAQHIGVSQQFVSSQRSSISYVNSKIAPAKRTVTRGGKTYEMNVSRIGSAAKRSKPPKPQAKREEDDFETIKEPVSRMMQDEEDAESPRGAVKVRSSPKTTGRGHLKSLASETQAEVIDLLGALVGKNPHWRGVVKTVHTWCGKQLERKD
jgi:uncharacterized ParB-like nuclease family protein